MTYVEMTLKKGEKQPIFFKQHPWQYCFPVVLVLAVAWFFSALGASGTFVASLVFIVIPAWLAVIWWRRRTTEYAVTDKRVVIKIGIIKRETFDIRFDAIESVGVSQGITGRLLGFGNCIIKGRGASVQQMRQVVNPLKVKLTIEEIAS